MIQTRMKKFAVLATLLCISLQIPVQEIKDNYIMSGFVRVLVGGRVETPFEVSVEIKQLHRLEISDSSGNFSFKNLKPGNYRLSTRGLGYVSYDTLITLIDKSIVNLSLLIKANCNVDRIVAEKDIKRKRPRLLLVGSIAPVYYPKQDEFEKKYHIQYYDFGDSPTAEECIIQYNRMIFEYLDSKFGKTWRQEVRRDVIGL